MDGLELGAECASGDGLVAVAGTFLQPRQELLAGSAPVRSPGEEEELLGVLAGEQSSRGVAGSSGSTGGTVGYLHGIRKTDISRALAKNRSYIRRRPMDQPEEPMPGPQTGEL